MKILNKLYAVALGALLLTGCQTGLEYEEVPESIYNNVNLTSAMCNVKARELFQDQIYAINWNKWVDNYISTVTIGNYQNGVDWTNETSASVTVGGVTVAPGETIHLQNSLTEEALASAPDGTLYVVNLYADSYAVYNTPNKGYLFDASKFSGDFALVNPTDGRSQQVILPVRKNEVIVEMLLSQEYNCKVKPQDGAPALGKPGDFTAPRRYLVVNESRRPDGQPAAQRLYEIRITFI